MAKLTPMYANTFMLLLIAVSMGAPNSAEAKAKTKSKQSKAITESALNLNFNDSPAQQNLQANEKSNLDLYTEDSFLDAEFATSEVKARRKKQSTTVGSIKKASPAVMVAAQQQAPTPPSTLYPAPSAVISATLSSAIPDKKLSLALSVSRSNSLYNYYDGSEGSSIDYDLSAGYKLDSSYKISSRIEASEDLKNSEKSGLVSGKVALSREGLEPLNWLEVTPAISLGLPVNKTQSSLESLLFGISASAGFEVKPEYLFSESLSLSSSLSLRKNFHEYSTAANGAVNVEYSSVQALSLGYSLSQKLSVSAGFLHMNQLSYEGSLRESFSFNQEVSYALLKNTTAALGHNNGGSVFKADGETSNISPYDENNSTVYVGLTLTY